MSSNEYIVHVDVHEKLFAYRGARLCVVKCSNHLLAVDRLMWHEP